MFLLLLPIFNGATYTREPNTDFSEYKFYPVRIPPCRVRCDQDSTCLGYLVLDFTRAYDCYIYNNLDSKRPGQFAPFIKVLPTAAATSVAPSIPTTQPTQILSNPIAITPLSPSPTTLPTALTTTISTPTPLTFRTTPITATPTSPILNQSISQDLIPSPPTATFSHLSTTQSLPPHNLSVNNSPYSNLSDSKSGSNFYLIIAVVLSVCFVMLLLLLLFVYRMRQKYKPESHKSIAPSLVTTAPTDISNWYSSRPTTFLSSFQHKSAVPSLVTTAPTATSYRNVSQPSTFLSTLQHKSDVPSLVTTAHTAMSFGNASEPSSFLPSMKSPESAFLNDRGYSVF